MQNHAVGVGGKSLPVTHSGTQAVCHSGDPGAAWQNLLLMQSSSKAGRYPSFPDTHVLTKVVDAWPSATSPPA